MGRRTTSGSRFRDMHSGAHVTLFRQVGLLRHLNGTLHLHSALSGQSGLLRQPSGRSYLQVAPSEQGGLLRHPNGKLHLHSVLSGQCGFSYLFALFALVLVGLSLTGANAQWKTMMQREREAELLYRGDQYRRAIAAYYYGQAGMNQYPLRVQDLISDPRNHKRYLRALYRDPISGKDFISVLCRDRIQGVVSPSEATPLKRENFLPIYAQFSGATTYQQWIFRFQPGQAPLPGQQTLPPPAAC